jgi:hypothetical protein
MSQSHNKPIIKETSPSLGSPIGDHIFDESKFNDAIFQNGYEVEIEKALRCPCANFNNGSAKTTCKNCGGSGWFFVEKRKTRILVSSMNRKTKYSNWTEEDKGTVSLSLRNADRVAFADRVKILDVESIFTQSLKIRNIGGKFFSFLYYNPLEIDLCYAFISEDKPLKFLNNGEDYKIVGNLFTLLDTSIQKEDMTISIRYYHNPMYSIIDINRDVMKNRNKDCNGADEMAELPISCVARKLHLVTDAPDIYGSGLLDNTNYDKD